MFSPWAHSSKIIFSDQCSWVRRLICVGTGNIKPSRKAENDLSWMEEIPAFSSCVTHAYLVHMVKIGQQLVRGCSYIESPLEPHKALCGCTKSCTHRNIIPSTDVSANLVRSLKFEISRQLHCGVWALIITCQERAAVQESLHCDIEDLMWLLRCK